MIQNAKVHQDVKLQPKKAQLHLHEVSTDLEPLIPTLLLTTRKRVLVRQRPTLRKQHDTKNSEQSLRLLTKASGCRNTTCCQLWRAITQI